MPVEVSATGVTRVYGIRNPHAGASRRLSHERFAAALGPGARAVETPTLDALNEAAADAARWAPELLVICGGDGTFTMTLSALWRAYGVRPLPALCVLPGGTMNVVARAMGIPARLATALAALHHALAGKTRFVEHARTSIAVDDQLGLLFGLGLIANFLEVYERGIGSARRVLGLLGRASAEAFAGGHLVARLFEPFDARLVVDGQRWAGTRWTSISAGGIEQLGLGFAPYIRAVERPGAFHFIAHDLTPARTVAQLPRLRFGRGMTGVTEEVVSRVDIELDRPRIFGLDGEVFSPRESLALHAGPTLRLRVPWAR